MHQHILAKRRRILAWQIDFYEDEQGESNVKEFLDSIENEKLKAKVLKDIGLLQNRGTELRKPHADYIEDGIWELRTKQSSNISRILYFTFTNNKIVLLNGFIKKQQKTPRNEIDRAKKYKNDYLRRFA